jgi:hypothetical protein
MACTVGREASVGVGHGLGVGIEGARQLEVLRCIAIVTTVRTRDCELRHARGIVDRHVQADDPAIAVADDNGALDFQLAHERDRVLGHVVVVERTIHVIGGASVSHLLDRDHLEPICEERDPLLRGSTHSHRGEAAAVARRRGPRSTCSAR